MRVQGVPPGCGPRPVRVPTDHEHRLRRGADLPRPATQISAPGRAGPLVGPTRITDAGPTGHRRSRRVGPVSHSPHPPRAGTRFGRGRGRPARARATHLGVTRARTPIAPLLLPGAAIATFIVFVGASVAAAAQGGTLGYDFLAYVRAARGVLDGGPLYDLSVHQAGAFGLFYYPPPVALLLLPFAMLPPYVATWLWTVAIVAAFGAGVALMPVRSSVRWATVLLAGLSWPFAYAVKLGQVGPILFLLFVIGCGWRELPPVLGASTPARGPLKIQ